MLAEAGGEQFTRELERLSRLAPSRGEYPLTVDPVINRHVNELLYDSDMSEDDIIALLAKIGINPPQVPGHRVVGVVAVAFDEDTENDPVIMAWDVRDINTVEEP